MSSLLCFLFCACVSAAGPFFDVVLFGATSNLAQKYLFQSLFTLSAESQDSLTVFAVGRAPVATWAPRLHALVLANTTCDRPATPRCASARADFASRVVRPASVIDDAATATLSAELVESAARPGWAGRVIYFAVASDVAPPLLSALAAHVDVRARTRIVIEKPVGSNRASAGEILDALSAHVDKSAILLVDHFLAKAGLALGAGLRSALAASSVRWRGALSAPVLTEALALEKEDCAGRDSYYNSAGAARDMLLTHMSLAAVAALQSTSAASISTATRAGVLAGLKLARTPTTGRVFALGGEYRGAAAHGLSGPGRTTAAGVNFESGGARVTFATAKATRQKTTTVRQVLTISADGEGVAAEAAARAACGPLTLTLHIQGELLAPSAALAAAVAALHIPEGAPSVLITGLCGAVRVALGDPRAAFAASSALTALVGGEASKWTFREDPKSGLWAVSLVSRPLSVDSILRAVDLRGARGAGVEETSSVEARLNALAVLPAVTGGDAYTSSIAAALVGALDRFISPQETDRLWQIWEGAIETLDADTASISQYNSSSLPAWLVPEEIGSTMSSFSTTDAQAVPDL